MVDKKDLAIAVLSTFCLTISLFTIIPTRTLLPTDNVNASKPEYDPWLDYNEDGIVDISDILDTALAFGSTGDTTKNVNVTNFPLDEHGNLNVNVVSEPLQAYKKVDRIILLESFSEGVGVEEGSFAKFWFDFNPQGNLINISRISIHMILSTKETWDMHRDYFYFNGALWCRYSTSWGVWSYPRTYNETIAYDDSFGGPLVTSSILKGINKLDFKHDMDGTNILYIHRLELFIEYCCLG
jgi:hypothetical protein